MCDDLPGILDDDLVRLKGTIATDTIATIGSLDDFNADVILAACFRSLLELTETAIPTFRTQSAIAAVALVEHVAVLTVLIAACLFLAHASGQLELFVSSPLFGGVTHKDI